MNTLPFLEKAEAYLHAHLPHHGRDADAGSVASYVTLSREAGTGGSALALALAARLSTEDQRWTVHSGNLIEEMLSTNNLPPHLAQFLPEDRISEIDASVGEIVGLHPNLWALIRKTNELMCQLARGGHVILLGRGARFATADAAPGIHLRLVGDSALRAAHTSRLRGISFEMAEAENAARDAARRRYVRANFGADVTDPGAYDLVINAARVPLPVIVTMVAQLLQVPRSLVAARA